MTTMLQSDACNMFYRYWPQKSLQ